MTSERRWKTKTKNNDTTSRWGPMD